MKFKGIKMDSETEEQGLELSKMYGISFSGLVRMLIRQAFQKNKEN